MPVKNEAAKFRMIGGTKRLMMIIVVIVRPVVENFEESSENQTYAMTILQKQDDLKLVI